MRLPRKRRGWKPAARSKTHDPHGPRGAGTLPAALPLLAAQASCARLIRLTAGCGQHCPPSMASQRFSSLFVGRRPIPTRVDARPHVLHYKPCRSSSTAIENAGIKSVVIASARGAPGNSPYTARNAPSPCGETGTPPRWQGPGRSVARACPDRTTLPWPVPRY